MRSASLLMNQSSKTTSPKRRTDAHKSNGASSYDYYAAFSHSFVADLIDELGLDGNDVLMDPWNGRGTTTTIAATKGLRAIGFDLNPAMVAIADARLVDRELAVKAYTRVKTIRPKQLSLEIDVSKGDQLLRWLTPRSVGFLRQFQRSFRGLSRDLTAAAARQSREGLVSQQRLEYFLTLSLSSTLRQVLEPLKTSNPTWIPQKLSARSRLRPSVDIILTTTKALLKDAVSGLTDLPATTSRNISIQQADSRFIPLPARSVSAVISSPPYCTRIDYAIATSPELFLLDLVSSSSFRELRERLLGTTVTHLQNIFHPPTAWGSNCIHTISRIRLHPSKASSSYYIKNFLQYFASLHDSIEEINRVTARGASIALVVQDSYYKEVHVDLPTIVVEMAALVGWNLQSKRDHLIASTMAASNPGSRIYRKDFSATESVLIFRKDST